MGGAFAAKRCPGQAVRDAVLEFRAVTRRSRHRAVTAGRTESGE